MKSESFNIYAISDLHISSNSDKPMEIFGPQWANHLEIIKQNWKGKILDNDFVLVPGDISWATKIEDARQDVNFFSDLPGTIIIIKGNHDYWWHSYSKVKEILPENVKPLQNNAIKIGNIIFAGSRGWSLPEIGESTSEHDEKILKREILRMETSLLHANKLKETGDKIFVLMHFPPFNSSCKTSLFTSLFEKYSAHTVVYGHLHGNKCLSIMEFAKNNIKYYLSSTDLIDHNPILIYKNH